MKKILVPTDFSEQAQWAMEVACGVAAKASAQVVLLHVVEQPVSDSFNVEGEFSDPGDLEEKLFMLQLIKKSKAQMKEAVAWLGSKGVNVISEIRLGNPFHGIKSIILDHKVDLVVMGTTGHSRLEQMIIGSNTDKVVRLAKCPILTVHQKPNGTEFKNIVYATSLTENESAFTDVVNNTQRLYNATVHVVRINTPLNFRSDTEVKKLMKNFAVRHKLERFTLNVFNDMSEEEGIIHFAQSIDADLICMATHGRTGFGHVLVGSIAEDVVNHTTKPVLTYVVA